MTVKQTPRPIEFDAEIRVEFAGDGSSAAEVSWQNAATMTALRQLFKLSAAERLAAVVVTARGIKAEIRRV